MSKIECNRSNSKFSPRSGARVVAQQQHIIDRETRFMDGDYKNAGTQPLINLNQMTPTLGNSA
jgi:hypothetical protein